MTLFFVAIAVSFAATFIGSVSGGSTSAISLPCWLAFGIPLPTAVATEKTAATFWTAIASRDYLRDRQTDWHFVAGLVIFGIIGAVLGTRVTICIDPKVMKTGIGAVILILVALAWTKSDFGLEQKDPTVSKLACSFFGFPLGFYEGILGSGNGLLCTLAFCKSRGFDFITSLGYAYLLAFAWCAAAAVAYTAQGYFNWGLTIPALIGSMLGAHAGSLLGSKPGARPVKILFSIGGVFFGCQLLLGL